MRPALIFVVSALGLATLAGCAEPSRTESHRDALLRERRELEDAHNKGLIDDVEYQRQRERLIQASYPGDWSSDGASAPERVRSPDAPANNPR